MSETPVCPGCGRTHKPTPGGLTPEEFFEKLKEWAEYNAKVEEQAAADKVEYAFGLANFVPSFPCSGCGEDISQVKPDILGILTCPHCFVTEAT